MIILDTNILSELLRPTPAPPVLAWLDELGHTAGFVSSVTQAEMLSGVALLPAGKRRQALEGNIGALFNRQLSGRCLSFDTQAAPTSRASLRAGARRAGRSVRKTHKLPRFPVAEAFTWPRATRPTLPAFPA